MVMTYSQRQTLRNPDFWFGFLAGAITAGVICAAAILASLL